MTEAEALERVQQLYDNMRGARSSAIRKDRDAVALVLAMVRRKGDIVFSPAQKRRALSLIDPNGPAMELEEIDEVRREYLRDVDR